jgi:hypothetical protein
MALTNPEEDEGLLVHTLMTESIFMLFPYFEDLWVAGFPDMLAPRERAKFMCYYRSCLQRHLYSQGGQRTLLCKSTSFPGRVESMLEAFPDARVIHLIRHPYETLPSHVSLFHQVWRVHSPEIAKDSPESRSYAQLAVEWYKQMLAQRERLEAHQYIRVRYAELKHDALGTIGKIYQHFSLPMSDAYRRRLTEATRGVGDYRSGHDYSLEEFGLSKEWVQQELGEVMDAYCFER